LVDRYQGLQEKIPLYATVSSEAAIVLGTFVTMYQDILRNIP